MGCVVVAAVAHRDLFGLICLACHRGIIASSSSTFHAPPLAVRFEPTGLSNQCWHGVVRQMIQELAVDSLLASRTGRTQTLENAKTSISEKTQARLLSSRVARVRFRHRTASASVA